MPPRREDEPAGARARALCNAQPVDRTTGRPEYRKTGRFYAACPRTGPHPRAQLAQALGKTKATLRIYDPYYCEGSMAKHLARLGFTDVYNRLVFRPPPAACGCAREALGHRVSSPPGFYPGGFTPQGFPWGLPTGFAPGIFHWGFLLRIPPPRVNWRQRIGQDGASRTGSQ